MNKNNRKEGTHKQPRFHLKLACAALLLAFTAQTVQANPIGAAVVNGQASFATTGNTLTVTNTPGAIINWQGFSIGANEITRFAQQSASSAVLNRVISNNPSSILGSLQSNGRVFLVNPNGIVFGQGATINVAGLVATSLNLSNADFLAGRNNFTQVPGAQNISNAGNLTAHGDGLGGGQIYLIAPNVENTGIITAPNGEILLAAGHSVELVNSNDPNLRVSITAPAGDATNVGKLVAEAGSLGLFGTVVRNSGTVSADSATLQGGKIVFKASQRVDAGGTISAQGVGGGTIAVLADMQNGSANVSGTLDASAPNSGDGGFIETSAAQVKVADTARITTAAPNGKTGTWLIDPVMDFTIAPTGGDTTGAAISLNLNTTDVVIQSTSGAVAGNGNIFVSDSITKTATGAATTLTLQADSSIIVAPAMAISSSGSALNVVFNANTAGGGGAIVMNTGSSITSNGGNIVMGGGADPLTNPATGFGTVDPFRHGILLQGATLNSGAGNISLIGKGASVTNPGEIGWGIVAYGVTTISASGGTIKLDGTAGAGPSDNRGVYMENAGTLIQSTNGDISIVGTGGAGPYTTGIGIAGGAQIISTGTAKISLVGTCVGTLDFNTGVGLYDAGTTVQSVNGDITITGTSTGSGIQNYGVQLNNGAGITSTGSAAIALVGTGAPGNVGIVENGTGTLSTAGLLTVNSTGGAILGGANSVGSFSAGNSGTGDILFNNAGDFNLGTVTNSAAGGIISVDGSNSITQTGNLITAGGAVLVTGASIAMGTLGAGNAVKTQVVGGSINYSSTADAIAVGLLDAGAGSVGIDSATSIIDNNVGGMNVIGNSLFLNSATGAAAIGLAISLDTKAASLSATVSQGIYTDISLRNKVSLTYAYINTPGAVTLTNAGSLATGVEGFISGNGVSITTTAGDIMVDDISSIDGGSSVTLNAAQDVIVDGGWVSATTGITGITTITAGRDIRVSATSSDGRIEASGEVHLTATSGKLYLTSGANPNSARISANNIATVYLNVPSLSSGGYVIDGIEGVATTSSLNPLTGIFVLGNPAIVGSTLIIQYAIPIQQPTLYTVNTVLASGSPSNTYGQVPGGVFSYTLTPSPAEGIYGTALFTPTISSLTPVGTYVVMYSGGLYGSISPSSYFITGAGLTYTVNPALLSAVNAVITGSITKVYDGTTSASLAPGNFLLSGFVNGDSVTVTKTTGTYASRNAGSGILVSTTLAPSDFSPVGVTSLSNYTLPTSASGNVGTITVRPLSTWSGLGGNNLWSNPANWDALPDGNNVLAVSIPGSGSVTFDGSVALQSITSAGNMLLNGNNLSIGSFSQTGGSLTGTGNLNVSNSFSQTGGTISLTGAAIASITQATGNLNIASLSAPAANLTASTGAITQTGSIIVAALNTLSATGTTLNDTGNRMSSFSANNGGSGNIALTNTGILNIAGINNSGGDILVDNTGAVTTTGAVSASGSVSIAAHSPLTIGNTISAGGNITLTAGAAGSTAAEDIITINGTISGSSITLAANSVAGTIPAGAALQIFTPATPTVLNNLLNDIIVIPPGVPFNPPTPPALMQTPADAATDADAKKKDAEAAAAAQGVLVPANGLAAAAAPMPVCR